MKFVRLFENFDAPALDVKWATGTFEGKLMMTVWKVRDNAYAVVNLEKHGDLWKIADKRVDTVQLWYGSREEGAGLPKDMSVDLCHHINDLLDADLEKQLGKNLPTNVTATEHRPKEHEEHQAQDGVEVKPPMMRGMKK